MKRVYCKVREYMLYTLQPRQYRLYCEVMQYTLYTI